MRLLERYFPWLLFVPAVVPLVFWQGMMYPLVTLKTVLLRGSIILALAGGVYLVGQNVPFYYGRLKHPSTWIPGLLLVLAYGASLAGIDFAHSFWSTFERGDGLLTLTACVASFYLLLLSAESGWLERLFRIVAWVGTVSAGYLMVQWVVATYGLSLPFIVPASGRLGGAMGNAAFLASYLGMSFFATRAVAHTSPRPQALFWNAASILQIGAIVLTSTRGSIVALGIVGIVFLGYLALAGRGTTRKTSLMALGGIALVVLLFVLFRGALSQSPIEPIRRLASISSSDVTVASRLFLSEHLAVAALEHPFLGYGAEHIAIPVNAVYDPSVLTEEWFDRSHNAYVDYAVQYGVAGPLLYLALIFSLLMTGWRLFKQKHSHGAAILGLTGVYALQNLFVFDTASTLWLLLATAAVARVTLVPHGDKTRLALPSIVGSVGALLLVGTLWWVVVVPLRTNARIFESYQYEIVDLPRSLSAAESAHRLGVYGDLDLGYNLYFIYTENQISRLTGSDLTQAYQMAVKFLSENFDRYPYDTRTAVYLAQVIDAAPEHVTPDNDLLQRALGRALEQSPKRPQPWYILVNQALTHANAAPAGSPERTTGYGVATQIIRQYLSLVPTLSMPHYVLAELLSASGDTEGAAREAELGRQYYRENLETALRATKYYEAHLDLPHAKFFLQEVLRIDPTNERAQADLKQILEYEKSNL